MGGYGSTRWNNHNIKTTVEECLCLSVFELKRDQLLQADFHKFGSWRWTNTFTKKEVASIGYEINTLEEISWLKLNYTTTDYWGKKTNVDHPIILKKSECRFGGYRWHFICPLIINNVECGKKVAKIYKPPNNHYFGCRTCHDLTYTSSQESRKKLSELKQLDPHYLMGLVRANKVDLIDALQVMKWGR